MAVTKELLQMDLYTLLGIEEKAADKEVKKAYRPLSCHPDKNPDNPKAAELFHQLSQALEVLTHAAARAAYVKVRKAKKQAAENEKRKKVKLDLEAREQQAQAQESEEEEESRSTRAIESKRAEPNWRTLRWSVCLGLQTERNVEGGLGGWAMNLTPQVQN
uniref:DnaJ homolog subfamily C member 17 n=1 Tax=Aotus nancymaae TaxID=37293 RepID=A0A2K5D5G2_AOTNA